MQYERRKVETGLSDGLHIEVKKGLKAGEKVRGPKKIGAENTTSEGGSKHSL